MQSNNLVLKSYLFCCGAKYCNILYGLIMCHIFCILLVLKHCWCNICLWYQFKNIQIQDDIFYDLQFCFSVKNAHSITDSMHIQLWHVWTQNNIHTRWTNNAIQSTSLSPLSKCLSGFSYAVWPSLIQSHIPENKTLAAPFISWG